MVNFESDEAQQEREIDHKTREITELFRHANGLLSTFKLEGEAVGISIAEKTVRTNMQRSLAKKLQGLSMSFKSTQKVCEILRDDFRRMIIMKGDVNCYANFTVGVPQSVSNPTV